MQPISQPRRYGAPLWMAAIKQKCRGAASLRPARETSGQGRWSQCYSIAAGAEKGVDRVDSFPFVVPLSMLGVW
ncbi:hypothetical protein MES5069_720013 [Mesorhizobium escarrei]|uniref:Uncharacterized protein n=1 Tax=Mesorhizobium escarrei TaxID=666018 RepID=A0ABM9EHI8_9HYPH|nr:hypothetical protein MES5069_720013 [Mesorhizobium escarrei]